MTESQGMEYVHLLSQWRLPLAGGNVSLLPNMREGVGRMEPYKESRYYFYYLRKEPVERILGVLLFLSFYKYLFI